MATVFSNLVWNVIDHTWQTIAWDAGTYDEDENISMVLDRMVSCLDELREDWDLDEDELEQVKTFNGQPSYIKREQIKQSFGTGYFLY